MVRKMCIRDSIHSAEYMKEYPIPVYGYFSEKNNQTYLPEEIVSSGTCGDDVNWKLTGDGTLTVSGSGAISDYNEGKAPWNNIRERIKHVVITNGITKIGNYAFFDCYKIEDVVIADTVIYLSLIHI